MQSLTNMAGSFRLLLLLVLVGVASSEFTKLKSNPDGNFAMGFKWGYINSGKYGVIVPKGDNDEKRQVQIRGPVRDSVTMEFNAHTMVFSDWDGMFMLGDKVYTDTLGTLYFVRSDKKCVKKKYKEQMGEIQVIEKEDVDAIICEAVRTKVEKAVSHFLTTPFKYLLPTASDKLKHTAGFPGGDFYQGLKHGEVTCGQHTVTIPTGDEHKVKTVKITAPGVSDEIKMVFDSDTKVFGSWDGVFFLGDTIFSVQPRTLVIKKEDKSCVKKYYASKGSEIIVDHSVLLKQEDCFLIQSKAYGAMQKLRRPSMTPDKDGGKKKKKHFKNSSSSEENGNKKKHSKGSSSSEENGNKKKHSKDSSSSEENGDKKKHSKDSSSSEENHGKKNKKHSKSSSSSEELIKKKKKIFTLKKVTSLPSKQQGPPPIHVTSTVIIPKQTQQNQKQQTQSAIPNTIVLPLQNNPPQPQVIAVQEPQPQSYYVQNSNDPSSNVVFQPLTVPAPALESSNDITLGGEQRIVNIQSNDIDLNTMGDPVSIQTIDPNQEMVAPANYVRMGRSISGSARPDNVVNTQILDVDASAISAARRGKSDTKIVGVQKSNLISANSGSAATVSDMKTTQITTVTLPSNTKSTTNSEDSKDKTGAQDIYVDTNVIIDQDSQTKSKTNPITVLPVKALPVAVASEGGKVINIQNNHVTLGLQESAISIQKNVVKLKSPTLSTTYIPVIDDPSNQKVLVRIGRNIQSLSRENVINLQNNNVNLVGSGDVTNAQRNNVDIDESNPTYLLHEKGPVLAYDSPKARQVLNIEDNKVNVDGLADVKNIQTNTVDLKLDTPVGLQGKAPQVLVRVPRKAQVLNIQKNEVSLNGGGDVTNFQTNKIEVNDEPSITVHRLPVLARVARSIPDTLFVQNPVKEVVNMQKNTVDLNGPGDVKNIQRNNVDVEANDNVVITPTIGPNMLSGTRKRIINIQDNNVNINGLGDATNIQLNDVKQNTSPATILIGKRKKRNIPQDSLPVLARVARSIPDTLLEQNTVKEVVNMQTNNVDMNGPGDVKNIQRNNVDVEANDNVVITPTIGPKMLLATRKRIVNFQDNNVDINGLGDVRNIQLNDVKQNTSPSAILIGKRKKRNIPQDVLNNQIVAIDGSSIAPQGGKVLALQGNDILVPVGPDGTPNIPNMKSSQVTKLTIPAQSGASDSQSPQKMYIKTNVLYNQNPQPQQPTPVYVQAPPKPPNGPRYVQVVNAPQPQVVQPQQPTQVYVQAPPKPSNGPRYVQVVAAPQPQVLLSSQRQVPRQTVYVRNVQPPVFIPASSLQTQSSRVNNQRQGPPTLVLANGGTSVNSQFHPGGVIHTVRQQNGGATTFAVVNTPRAPSSPGQGRIPVTLMKDLTMLKRLYNPSNMIVNIAQNTNFQKK